MSDSTQVDPLTCAGCGRPMQRNQRSLPQGEARCHPCRRGEPPTFDLFCSTCGKGMYRNRRSSLPQGEATCLPCRRARPKHQPRTKQPPTRTCPLCRRTFQHNRRTYCGSFCRLIGSRLGGFRDLVDMRGSYQPALWWYRTPDDARYFQGPPPPNPLDVWTTVDDKALCPACGHDMGHPIPSGNECQWCCIKIITLATAGLPTRG